MNRILALCILLSLALVACDESNPQQPTGGGGGPAPTYTYQAVQAFPNLTFKWAVDIQNAGDGTDRLFVVEKEGTIKVFANNDAVATMKTFLDITARVVNPGGGSDERGLLGLVFDPGYAGNGFFYVHYIDTNGDSKISRFSVTADPDVADSNSEVVVITVVQPFGNHNAGGLAFDNNDYLLIPLGDGGGGGDPGDRAQNRANLLGSMLRVDVSSLPYTIPASNPFVGNTNGWREEVYAYGLRNPFRVSVDPVNGNIWTGDVGQGAFEEVNLIMPGLNYGWDCREGFLNYNGPPGGPSAACPTATDITDPILAYDRNTGTTVTGGYVYRGSALMGLSGKYIYADYGNGMVWALSWDGTTASNEPVTDANFNVSTFGVDEAGEIYFPDYNINGNLRTLYRLEETEVPPRTTKR